MAYQHEKNNSIKYQKRAEKERKGNEKVIIIEYLKSIINGKELKKCLRYRYYVSVKENGKIQWIPKAMKQHY